MSAKASVEKNGIRLSLMEWEADLLARRIGRIESLESIQNLNQANRALREIEKKARQRKFELLVSRINASAFAALWALEAAGFLLVDLGVTFQYDLDSDIVFSARDAPVDRPLIREATCDDISILQRIATGLFLTSYYYVNPLLSKDEADLLYRTWVSNCVKKEVADQVLLAVSANQILGFVTCRLLADNTGVVDLLGVKRRHQSQGVGKALVKAALEYFKDAAVRIVRVRTQITNTASVNLYGSTGFYLRGADTTFMKSLKE